MLRTIRNFIADESGATAIEYGLIAALVSVAAIGAFEALGSSISGVFNVVTSTINSKVPTGG